MQAIFAMITVVFSRHGFPPLIRESYEMDVNARLESG